MNAHDYRFLLSEQATLKDLIDRAPEGSIITRMGLESRLRQVEEELEAYEGYSPRVVSARLTFRGKPVLGGHGIRVDFASEATKEFADAVAKVGGSWRREGKPDADYGLVITGTARGSFGFTVEDAGQTPHLEGESTPVERAIDRVKDIMAAATGTEDQLASALADTDERALSAIRKFLKTVADNDAVCAVELGDDRFAFQNAEQVRNSLLRLDNVKECDVHVSGHFQGFLPKGRRAEFVVESSDDESSSDLVGDVISARVAASVVESVPINEMLGEPVRVSARARRVGDSRPRYAINSCERVGSTARVRECQFDSPSARGI